MIKTYKDSMHTVFLLEKIYYVQRYINIAEESL
jgi:hypothetical protein